MASMVEISNFCTHIIVIFFILIRIFRVSYKMSQEIWVIFKVFFHQVFLSCLRKEARFIWREGGGYIRSSSSMPVAALWRVCWSKRETQVNNALTRRVSSESSRFLIWEWPTTIQWGWRPTVATSPRDSLMRSLHLLHTPPYGPKRPELALTGARNDRKKP